MTAWDNQESMRRFMTSGSHKDAMPQLLDWCDEAAVVHWEQPEAALPSWTEADQRMRLSGRASKVRKPSAQHAIELSRPACDHGGNNPAGKQVARWLGLLGMKPFGFESRPSRIREVETLSPPLRRIVA